ncbi:MAG: methyltransferase domain-containing protein [Actinomycetota bacterium]|nr:methyltransferase domain-containing protein [Actinomycetota bacterium]
MHCDYFDAGRCRSCALMGVPYAVQLADKQAGVEAALRAVAPGATWHEPFAGAESGFRNKAKLVVGGRAGGVTLGILDGDRRGVDLRRCGLHEPALRAVLPTLAQILDDLGLEPYDVPAHRGELKYLLLTASPDDELMLRLVLRTRHHLGAVRDALPQLMARVPGLRVVSVNLHPEHKAVLEGDTEVVLTSATDLPMRVAGLTLHLRPRSFFQTNTVVAAGLYEQARAWVEATSPATLWDLYCGVGGFALAAATTDSPPAHVLGVEVSEEAVDSARRSADALGLGAVVDVVAGDATLVTHGARPAADLVVVNPPRRGIGDLAGWLEASSVGHVVYSSCRVESLARDLAAMPSLRVREARLFDMFPQTTHHEVMVRLERR